MKPALAELLHNPLVWRGDQLARVEETVPSGFAALDGELPGGGWPQGALTELLLDAEGIGELRLLLPALRRLTQAGDWIAFVAPPHLLHAPAFAVSGVDPAKLIAIDAGDEKNRWWAAEQVLRANSAGALLFWPETVNDQRLRRLQLAAQDGKSPAFVFAGAARAAQSSPAPLRLRLARAGTMLRIDVFKRRGGVVTQPLLLDVATRAPLPMKDERPGMTSIRAAATSERPPAVHSTRFNRRYPIGAPQAPVWNRALARADEVRRSPNPDPRG
jgi:cell division inhibitor SulA